MYLDTKDKKWILIVDDEPDIRSALKEVISLNFDDDIKVIEAKDGVEATTKINYQKFDLIVTDLAMPKKEGEAFIHSVRSNNLNDATPIIVVSGSPSISKVQDAFEFVESIEKPYKMKDLVETISTCLKTGDNKKRVSANVLNNLIVSVDKFVESLEKGKISQDGPVTVKERGCVVDHDYVSSIQVKIGSVTNTFSILAREENIRELFSKQNPVGDKTMDRLMQSMSFVILKYVLEKASLKKSSTTKGSYIKHDRNILTDKKGIIIGLGNENLKIDLFATSE